MTSPILEMKNVSKRFGATAALKDLSFKMFAGEIHALVGENGADNLVIKMIKDL